jgi:hypothetical protein
VKKTAATEIVSCYLTIDKDSFPDKKYSIRDDMIVYRGEVVIKLRFIETVYNAYNFSISVSNHSGKKVILDPKTFFYTPLYNDSRRVGCIDPFETISYINKRINNQNYVYYDSKISKTNFDYPEGVVETLRYLDQINGLKKQKSDFSNAFSYSVLENSKELVSNLYFPVCTEDTKLCFHFAVNQYDLKFVFNNHILKDRR